MLFCEAAGMVPQLAATANPYGVPVISSGGFDSLTEKYGLAQQIAESLRPVEVLHIGDYDQSGIHTALNLAEDVQAFVGELGGEAEFTRLVAAALVAAGTGTATASHGRLALYLLPASNARSTAMS